MDVEAAAAAAVAAAMATSGEDDPFRAGFGAGEEDPFKARRRFEEFFRNLRQGGMHNGEYAQANGLEQSLRSAGGAWGSTTTASGSSVSLEEFQQVQRELMASQARNRELEQYIKTQAAKEMP